MLYSTYLGDDFLADLEAEYRNEGRTPEPNQIMQVYREDGMIVECFKSKEWMDEFILKNISSQTMGEFTQKIKQAYDKCYDKLEEITLQAALEEAYSQRGMTQRQIIQRLAELRGEHDN